MWVEQTLLQRQLLFEQCDNIFKLLATNFLAKVAQIFMNILAILKNVNFTNSNCFGYFLGNFQHQMGLSLVPTHLVTMHLSQSTLSLNPSHRKRLFCQRVVTRENVLHSQKKQTIKPITRAAQNRTMIQLHQPYQFPGIRWLIRKNHFLKKSIPKGQNQIWFTFTI